METQVKSDKDVNAIIERHLEALKSKKVNRKKEKEYIRANLMYYINQHAKTTRWSYGGFGWQIESNRNTDLRLHCVEYAVRCYTLYELELLFYYDNYQYGLEREFIQQAKRIAIDNITNDDYYTGENARRLIKKVKDMNPIVFGLLHELIQESNIFWDEKESKHVFPAEYYHERYYAES